MNTQSFLTASSSFLLAAGIAASASSLPQRESGTRAGFTDERPSGAALPGEFGLGGGPTFTFRGPGMDFVQGSVTTRTAGVGQGCPFLVSVPALPPGATEVFSLARWSYLKNGLVGSDTIHINGMSVPGIMLGTGAPDLCWGKDYGVSFLAIVTGMLNNGSVNLIDDACDKAMAGDPAALGEGITLITVYEFDLGPDREVDLWIGYTSTSSSASGDAVAVLDFTTEYHFGAAHFFFNALDGQLGGGEGLAINGHPAGGSFPGTNVAGDAWAGLLGPSPNNNLYDAADGDCSNYLDWGDTSLTFRTLGAGDCIGHTLAAMSHQVECGDVAVYCTAKVNSLGCTPQISTTGHADPTGAGPFHIRASNIINNKNGLLFYGYQPAAIPLQGGYLCVKPPIQRTSVQNSGGNPPPNDCSGAFDFEFNAHIQGGTDPDLIPGAFVFAQYWSRDPNDAFTTSLSDAVGFDICP